MPKKNTQKVGVFSRHILR